MAYPEVSISSRYANIAKTLTLLLGAFCVCFPMLKKLFEYRGYYDDHIETCGHLLHVPFDMLGRKDMGVGDGTHECSLTFVEIQLKICLLIEKLCLVSRLSIAFLCAVRSFRSTFPPI